MSDNGFDIVRMITSNLWMIPQGIVMLVGMLLAIANWSRHPTVSLLAALAFAGMLLNMVGGQVVFTAVLRSEFEYHKVLPILGFLRSSVDALALAVLAAAVFMRRSLRPVESYPADLKPQDWK